MNLKKLSGYHLKFIAVISMLIDHIAVLFQASLSESIYFILRAAEKDQGVDIFIDTILTVRLFSFH